MPARQLPDDPQEWLNRARSNLALARVQGQDIYGGFVLQYAIGG